MTVPTTMDGEFSEGNTCTALDLRYISRLALSCTLLARSLFQGKGRESRYVSASGSASSDIRLQSDLSQPMAVATAVDSTWCH